MSGGPTTLGARWVFPATAPPIRDGAIVVDDAGQIAWVGPASDSPRPVDRDLGDVAILPGFVNAHTHLDLGPLPPEGEPGGPEDEIAWLRRVIASRFARSKVEIAALIRRNLARALAAGTTSLADISAGGRSWEAVAAAPIWGTVFLEILGLSDARARSSWAGAVGWLQTIPAHSPGDRARLGLSPHAPYSTAGYLYERAADSGRPVSTHLGEMPEEREFLRDRAGPLRRFVEGLGAWDEDWQPLGPTLLDYVPRGTDFLIAHGNIFEPDEFSRLAADRSRPGAPRVAVAYCPRTHARFGHPPHPFRAMLGAGVVVCLGTDSRASAPTLSVLDEVRFLRHQHPDVPGSTLLAMATINGAWALRRDDATGSIESGKSADLAVLPLPPGDPPFVADPHALWLDHDAPPVATMFRGRFVAGDPAHPAGA